MTEMFAMAMAGPADALAHHGHVRRVIAAGRF